MSNMRKIERTLAVIGSTSVGKSALTVRFIRKDFSEEYDPTIAKTYHHNVKLNGAEYALTIADTAGIPPKTGIPEQYINSQGFALVYSIADTQSFETVNDIYQRLIDELNGRNVPIVLIGNKSDLNEQRQISSDQGHRLVQSWRDENNTLASFIETSALTGDNVDDVFFTLLNLHDRPASLNSNSPATTTNRQQTSTTARRPAPGNDRNCIIS